MKLNKLTVLLLLCTFSIKCICSDDPMTLRQTTFDMDDLPYILKCDYEHYEEICDGDFVFQLNK